MVLSLLQRLPRSLGSTGRDLGLAPDGLPVDRSPATRPGRVRSIRQAGSNLPCTGRRVVGPVAGCWASAGALGERSATGVPSIAASGYPQGLGSLWPQQVAWQSPGVVLVAQHARRRKQLRASLHGAAEGPSSATTTGGVALDRQGNSTFPRLEYQRSWTVP